MENKAKSKKKETRTLTVPVDISVHNNIFVEKLGDVKISKAAFTHILLDMVNNGDISIERVLTYGVSK